MSGPTWYADQAAKLTHRLFMEHMKPFLAQMMPGYTLSHMGIDRIPDRLEQRDAEVRITLHLNPIGAVRVVPDSEIRRLER